MTTTDNRPSDRERELIEENAQLKKMLSYFAGLLESTSYEADIEAQAQQSKAFLVRKGLYEDAAWNVQERGVEHCLQEITEIYEARERVVGDDAAILICKELVQAIGQGMSIGEYMESDSPRSWLDRHDEENAN